MARTFFLLILASAAPVLWAQTPPLQTTEQSLTKKSELICIHEDQQKTCSLYTVNGLKTNWPWLSQLIRKQSESEQPVLTAKRLPVPTGFKTKSDWVMQREYAVKHTGTYRDLVGIEYSGWDYGNGAAHGNPYASHNLYDAQTQQEVSFADMVLPEKKEALKQALQQSFAIWLNREQDDNKGRGAVEEQDDVEEYWPEHAKISDSVTLSKQGVVFHYGVYELGAYAMGTPDLELTWKQVLPMLKPQWRQRLK